MIIIRRNAERRHIKSDTSEMLLTFYPQENGDTLSEGFGSISILNELRLPPNEGVSYNLVGETELLTYVYKGAIALVSPTGSSSVIIAGEFQCMTIGRVLNYKATNMSRTDLAHFFQIYLHLQPEHHRIGADEVCSRFTAAQRRNMLCAVASPDGRETSLRILPDAIIYSSILDPGQHIVHELLQGREAWLHIVYGKATANDINLLQGDSMGIAKVSSVSVTVQEKTELLLIDTIQDSYKIIRSQNTDSFDEFVASTSTKQNNICDGGT